MSQLMIIRRPTSTGYAVLPVSFDGYPLGPEFRVVNVGQLERLPAAFVRSVMFADPADLVRRFTRKTWVALRNDGSVFKSDTTKRDVCRQVLEAYESV